MIDLLQSHRDTLAEFLVTTRNTPLDGLSVGFRLTLGIYAQILIDAVSVLNSMIAFLEQK